MANRMLQFTHLDRAMPDKRAPEQRSRDFHEIYGDFIAEKAKEQASRCSQCGVPFCQVHCPLHNNIPDWLMMTAEGRLEEAFELAQATNTFPEICGRICPQDRLCEGNCVIEQSEHGTVTIGAVERYVTETAWNDGWVRPITPGPDRGATIGIVGAGPAGLAAGEVLRRLGYGVDIYDRYDRVGGLMIYGIPGFKLEKSVVERRTTWLEQGGIRFHLNCEVGRDVSFAALRERHDALLIATGVYKARALTLPGAGLGGIHRALDYLTASNRAGLGDPLPNDEAAAPNAHDRDVVVIGGGDTAMDCVRTAVRQGARSVTCLYRRDRENMPGSDREVGHAMEEGVDFRWLSAPRAILGETTVSGVRAAPVRLGPPDAAGRRQPHMVDGADVTVPADMVIEALGFDPEDLPGMFKEPDLAIGTNGTIRTRPKSMMTNLDGVFAAGDIVRGASLVVWAIREGRDAARDIHSYLKDRSAAHAAGSEAPSGGDTP